MGIEKYISECGYRNSTVTYAGWDTFHTKYSDPVRIPDMTFIKNGFENAGSVLLNIGWYVYDPKAETYNRKSGHWVTLAGYGMDISGHVCPDILVIHDPAPWAGKDFQNHYVRLKLLIKEYLKGLLRDFLSMEEGFSLPVRVFQSQQKSYWYYRGSSCHKDGNTVPFFEKQDKLVDQGYIIVELIEVFRGV